jgi:hypothetical protein
MKTKFFCIFFFFYSAISYPQVNRLGEIKDDPAPTNYRRNITYYHAGEIGNRHGKNFEISFELNGNAVIVFYKKDNAVAYSGARPEMIMIDNCVWFNSSYSYTPYPKNWVSTHRYNFMHPAIDDVEGNCSVQTQAYPDRFLLYIYNSAGFNKIRLFLPFQLNY